MNFALWQFLSGPALLTGDDGTPLSLGTAERNGSDRPYFMRRHNQVCMRL